MNRPSHQSELPLTSETVNKVMPEDVIAECRQLLAQLLREVWLAEKEAEDEH